MRLTVFSNKCYSQLSKFALGFGLVLSLGAPAQAQMGNVAPDKTPSFQVSAPWEITKTNLSQVRGLQDMALPCLMTAEFDNGFIMRVSGGGNQILSMAIDFRQGVFSKGKRYSALVTVGGQTRTIKARAFAPNILLFNVREWSGFYAAMQKGSAMILDVEGNKMRFDMGAMGSAMNNLERCFDPQTVRDNGGVMPVALPDAGNDIEWNDARQMSNGTIEREVLDWERPKSSAPVSLAPPKAPIAAGPSSVPQLWSARAGEPLDAVLTRWGNQAGVDVSWQAGAPMMVQSDFEFNGGFTQAVQTLMAQNAALSGLKANLIEDGAMVNARADRISNQPQSLVPEASNAPAPMQKPAEARWSAPAGSSLQGVLRYWAEREGVEFVWQSSQNWDLKRGVNASNSFEAAVQSALEQFSSDRTQPTARLNKDPKTGQRVLFVMSDKG